MQNRRMLSALLAGLLLVGVPVCGAAEEQASPTGAVTKTSMAKTAAIPITAELTQAEIDACLAATDNTVFQVAPGDYSLGSTAHKTLDLDRPGLTVHLGAGDYTALQLIVREDTEIVLDGDVTIDSRCDLGNPAAALFIGMGQATLSGGHQLMLKNGNHGVRLGYFGADRSVSAGLTVAQDTALVITGNRLTYGQNYAGGGYDDAGGAFSSAVDKTQGNGTSGAGIDIRGYGVTALTLEEGAVLDIHENENAAIFGLMAEQFTLSADHAQVLLDDNYQGVCLNSEPYVNRVQFDLRASTLSACDNMSNGFTGQAKPYVVHLQDSEMQVDDNGGHGVNNFFLVCEDSELSVSRNAYSGATNIGFTADGSEVHFDENGLLGANIIKANEGTDRTEITSSTVTADRNGGAGLRFMGTIPTRLYKASVWTRGNGGGDYLYGYAVKPGDANAWSGVSAKNRIEVEDSVLVSESTAAFAHYNSAEWGTTLAIGANSVLALRGTETELAGCGTFYNAQPNDVGTNGRTVMTGGSLQGERKDMAMDVSWPEILRTVLNPVLYPEVTPANVGDDAQKYNAPINNDGTVLTRFDLHDAVNTEVGAKSVQAGASSRSFVYYDPHTGQPYEYAFRFNEIGEDLDETASGNAYVWTPQSRVRFDTTEGILGALGTAETLPQEDWAEAQDNTIFGNSMALAERVLPTASRSGYRFAGWYYSTENGEVRDLSELAAAGEYAAVYDALNTPFTAKTKVAALAEDPESGVEELTVYAKWEKQGSGGTSDSVSHKTTPLLNLQDHYAYIVGYPEGDVRPQASISREEVATIFFRMMQDDARAMYWTRDNAFSDVNTAENWSNNGISTLAASGVLLGYPDGTFRPEASITRAEFATIAAQFDSGSSAAVNGFSDTAGHWASEAIDRAAARGWIHGYPDGTFRPDQPITRAEAMTLVNAVLERHPQAGHLQPDMIVWPDNADLGAWYYLAVQEATNSHDYSRAEQSAAEDWTEIISTRDWIALEKTLSDTYEKSTIGEVVQ